MNDSRINIVSVFLFTVVLATACQGHKSEIGENKQKGKGEIAAHADSANQHDPVEQTYDRNERKEKLQLIQETDICVDIQRLYDSKHINQLFIGSPQDNYKRSFFVDIDNDGQDEEFQYFASRTHHYVAEILEGNVSALPRLNTTQGVDNYSGNSVIKYGEKFLQYHGGTEGPLEVQQLTEKTSEEKLKNPKQAHINYHAETLCKYY